MKSNGFFSSGIFGAFNVLLDDDSQRGDTACGFSRTYLIREPFNVEHQGKGCSEECNLGNAGMLARA